MLARVLINVGELRPRVYQELTKKTPIASTYQALAKDEEGLTRDVEGITETIRSCVRDEGLNKS
jgi:hypothetical protein